jgi:hypothetical protein
VVVASDGRTTARQAWRQVPDVVLLDLPLTTLREHKTWNGESLGFACSRRAENTGKMAISFEPVGAN